MAPDRTQVLHFADNVNRWDPIDTIASHLDPARFRVAILRLEPRANIAALEDRDDRPIFDLKWRGAHHYIEGARALVDRTRELGTRIVHTHHFYPALIASVARLLFRPPWRLVVSRHYADLLDYTPSRRGKVFARSAELLVNRSADRLIAISSTVDDALGEASWIRRKVVRLLSGFDPEKYEATFHQDPSGTRERFGVADDEVVIGAFGRQDPPKAFDRILVAARRSKQRGQRVRLWMVGDGPSHDALRRQAELLGIEEDTTFFGWRTDAMELMRASDIVCHPSVSEAYSQVGAEAMFLARPLVMTSGAGNRDTIISGRNGFIVEPNDQSSLDSVLERLIESSELRREVGQHARTTALRELHFKDRLARIEALYEDVLAPTSTP